MCRSTTHGVTCPYFQGWHGYITGSLDAITGYTETNLTIVFPLAFLCLFFLYLLSFCLHLYLILGHSRTLSFPSLFIEKKETEPKDGQLLALRIRAGF